MPGSLSIARAPDSASPTTTVPNSRAAASTSTAEPRLCSQSRESAATASTTVERWRWIRCATAARGALAEEDDPVGVRALGDRAQKRGQTLDQQRLGVLDVGVGRQAGLDRLQHPRLLALQKRLEELLLAGEAGVDDRLGDPGGAGHRLHRGPLVSMLQKEVEGGVENQRAAALWPQVGSAAAPAALRVIELTDAVVPHFLLMVAFSYRE